MIVCKLIFCRNYIDYRDCSELSLVDGEILWGSFFCSVGDFVGDFFYNFEREWGTSLRILKLIFFLFFYIS